MMSGVVGNATVFTVFLIITACWISLSGAAATDIDGDEWSQRTASSEYSAYAETTISVKVPNSADKNRQAKSTLTPDGHVTEISLSVAAFGQSFELKMFKNRYLFSSSYVEKLVSDKGSTYISSSSNNSDTSGEHCYYTGTVNGQIQSTAAISTCNGILGYFELSGEAYSIEPVDSSLSGRHRVYRESDSLAPPHRCGNYDDELNALRNATKYMRMRKKRSFNWPQDSDGTTNVVELYIVNDVSQFGAMGRNVTATIARTKNVVNIASALFQQLDVYLVLVGIEIWTDRSLITINKTDVSGTLNRFTTYRELSISPLHPNDNAQLITQVSHNTLNVTYTDGVVGLAWVSGMCSYDISCAIIGDIRALPTQAATTMAHEMGHNFGFRHDDQLPWACSCDDPSGTCIMNSFFGSQPQTHWSQCSRNQLTVSLDQQINYCLHNVPQLLYEGTPVCGNGILETGEQCDCGGASTTKCNATCCSPTTCRLVAPATCASGRCCDLPTCQFKPITTPCRLLSGPCDLSEYCSGVDALCPSDVYLLDGTACTDNTVSSAYCYEGQCRSHRSQCQLWFGPTADNSADICYNYLNVFGQWYGHCGYNASTPDNYWPCADSDVDCGLLHCNFVYNGDKSTLRHFNFSQASGTYLTNNRTGEIAAWCTIGVWNAFYAGGYVENPSLVPDGAACGNSSGNMCLNQKCVSVSSINVMTCPDCHQHGWCNNIGQCHCNFGYAPPDCSIPGGGGSSHSNPITVGGTAAPTVGTTTMTTTTTTTTVVAPTSNPTRSTTSTATTPTTQTSKPSNQTTSPTPKPFDTVTLIIIITVTVGSVSIVLIIVTCCMVLRRTKHRRYKASTDLGRRQAAATPTATREPGHHPADVSVVGGRHVSQYSPAGPAFYQSPLGGAGHADRFTNRADRWEVYDAYDANPRNVYTVSDGRSGVNQFGRYDNQAFRQFK